MEGRMPLIGDTFPRIEVTTTSGSMILPDFYSGKWFIFFSYPADFAPVGTTEFVAFQKRFHQFRELNCNLIGLSMDQVLCHLKWLEWIKDNLDVEIQFPVIADTGRVSDELGLTHLGKGTCTVRAVFIVDPKGIVRAILSYPPELGRNTDEILRMVKGLQVNDKHNVALPAGWPDNELIKDEVIVPPPSDRKIAQEQAKNYECFDWWFCHKKLE
jgi:peroxiredoxin (alkyl hydroperoxide reductase subunit C)